MARRDRILRFTSGLLQMLILLNLLIATAFAVSLLATWPAAGAIGRQLSTRYGPELDVADALAGLRGLFVIGLVAAGPIHAIFVNLRAVVASALGRDPFSGANAARVRAIGWGLLAIQLLDIPLLLLVRRLDALGVETVGYTPSAMGWVAVLVAFVLARVFADGAEMHKAPGGTV